MNDTRPPMGSLGSFDTRRVEAACRRYLTELRWPKGAVCPRCAGTTTSQLTSRRAFECSHCRYQFSVTTGTLLHDSHLPLVTWLLGVFFMCELERPPSATQLKRTLGISYQTAWYLRQRIRRAIVDLQAEQRVGSTESATDPAIDPSGAAVTEHLDRYLAAHAAGPASRTNPHLFRDVLLHLVHATRPGSDKSPASAHTPLDLPAPDP